MADVDVETDGFLRAIASLERLPGKIESHTKSSFDARADLVRTNMRMQAPVDTGDLKASIDVSGPLPAASDGWFWTIGPDEEYDAAVAFGADPHPIPDGQTGVGWVPKDISKYEDNPWYGIEGDKVFAPQVMWSGEGGPGGEGQPYHRGVISQHETFELASDAVDTAILAAGFRKPDSV